MVTGVEVSSESLTIGEVARRARIRPSALRYYDEIGLVRPARRVGQRRVYDHDALERLALIGLAKEAGFTMREIKVLLSGFANGTPASSRWQALAGRKREELSARIERATQMRGLLDQLLDCQCETLGQCVATSLLRPRTGDQGTFLPI